MLSGEVDVIVTHEEHHQGALAHYRVAAGGQRLVAVELAWCRIRSGKYRGQPAIEVRLDGQRVGELTYLMSQRYAGLVRQVQAHSGRPGCEARIQLGARGLEVVLRLPRQTTGVLPMPAVPKPRARSRRPLWIAAAVVGVILLGAAISNASNDRQSAANPPLDTSTAAPASTTVPELTTTSTQPTTTNQPTTTTTIAVQVPAAPEPAKTTTKTTTTNKPAPPPPPPATVAPQPQSGCDPNYTGCVPIASDVDCAGGSGDGPAYVQGPVRVIGRDIYRLDADHDGIACE
jgi:hypothetical protein